MGITVPASCIFGDVPPSGEGEGEAGSSQMSSSEGGDVQSRRRLLYNRTPGSKKPANPGTAEIENDECNIDDVTRLNNCRITKVWMTCKNTVPKLHLPPEKPRCGCEEYVMRKLKDCKDKGTMQATNCREASLRCGNAAVQNFYLSAADTCLSTSTAERNSNYKMMLRCQDAGSSASNNLAKTCRLMTKKCQCHAKLLPMLEWCMLLGDGGLGVCPYIKVRCRCEGGWMATYKNCLQSDSYGGTCREARARCFEDAEANYVPPTPKP